MRSFRILQKTASNSKRYLIDLYYIKYIFRSIFESVLETYFEHPTCKGKSFIITKYLKLLPLQGDRFASVFTQGDALG